MMRKTVGVAIAATLLMLIPGSPVATAHLPPGVASVITVGEDGYLEGETYSHILDGCDPAADGDHTLPLLPDVLGVQSAKIPYSHCMFAWWDLKNNEALEFKDIRVRIDNPALSDMAELPFTVRIWADSLGWPNQNLVGQATTTLTPGDGYVIVPLSDTKIIPVSSYYTVKVEFIPGAGVPADSDLYVDWIRFGGQCPNIAPVLDAIDVDGLLDGLIGWAGVDPLTTDPYDYVFDIQGVTDPNGDPYEIIVEWSDGLTQRITEEEYVSGLTSLTRSFNLTDPTKLVSEVVSFVVTIVDDPSLRCLEESVDALYKSLPLDFVVIPDLVADLLSPIIDVSCHDGQIARTWTDTGLDAIFGSCPTAQTVNFAGLPPGSIVGELRVGDRSVASAVGTDLNFMYDATAFAEGLQDMQACYSVLADKFSRDFCSEPYYFENNHCTNALPTLAGVTGDGMVDGLTGWLGLPYTFTADHVDRDGDPVTVEWIWDDQTSDFGATVEKTFYDAGGHPFQVRLIEDPSGRCPGAPTEEVVVQGQMFMGATDLLPDIVRPKSDMSCIGGRYVPTLFATGQDVMASQCTIEGKVDDLAPGLETVIQGSFVLDGQEIHQQRASVISKLYDSLRYPTHESTLHACFEADDDKYERVFCSEGFRYLNIGR